MAPATNTSNSIVAGNTWAIPIAATILVAGSLLFWSCIGLLWLAARQPPQAPIVIWMPPAANSSTAGQSNASQFSTASMPQDR
jgi:hypothetical protein